METTDAKTLEITAEPNDLDEDQFVSIWNVAASSMGGDTIQTRMLASKLLGFLCKHRCGFVVTSPSDAKYLDEFFERDNSLLYKWTPESESVDVLAQHALVPFDLLLAFLRNKKFTIEKAYSPCRLIEWLGSQTTGPSVRADYENPFPREADLARGKLAILPNGLQQLAVVGVRAEMTRVP